MNEGDRDNWPVDEPSAGFADRLVRLSLEERARTARRGRAARSAFAACALLAAAAGLLLWSRSRSPAWSELRAERREERAIGERAVVVAEAGAELRFRGDEVEQRSGEVFYRVNRGGAFRVHTPAGDVAVLGTCFRVWVQPGDPGGQAEKEPTDMKRDLGKVAVGALAGAVAVVGVYEGRVRLSHASEQVDLRAGEAGRVDGRGARRLSTEEREAAESAAREAREGAESPFAEANRNLAENVQNLGRKLTSLEEQKGALQKQLEEAQEKLARAGDGGARVRSDFDLTHDDWAELAKSGTIKFRVPCSRPGGWSPPPDKLQSLGLSPDDAPAIQRAYRKSNERAWAQIKPLCVGYIGSAEVADKLGVDTCTHLILDLAHTEKAEAANEAMRQVGEIRAGQRPEPGAGDAVHPVERLFLTLTGEMTRFEADLSASFGPEEAHRLAYAKDLCAGHSTFGGPGPRDP